MDIRGDRACPNPDVTCPHLADIDADSLDSSTHAQLCADPNLCCPTSQPALAIGHSCRDAGRLLDRSCWVGLELNHLGPRPRLPHLISAPTLTAAARAARDWSANLPASAAVTLDFTCPPSPASSASDRDRSMISMSRLGSLAHSSMARRKSAAASAGCPARTRAPPRKHDSLRACASRRRGQGRPPLKGDQTLVKSRKRLGQALLAVQRSSEVHLEIGQPGLVVGHGGIVAALLSFAPDLDLVFGVLDEMPRASVLNSIPFPARYNGRLFL